MEPFKPGIFAAFPVAGGSEALFSLEFASFCELAAVILDFRVELISFRAVLVLILADDDDDGDLTLDFSVPDPGSFAAIPLDDTRDLALATEAPFVLVGEPCMP